MNLERIKILKNIVNDLRSRNELDEDKWKAYKESRDYYNIFFAFLTFILGSISCFTESIFTSALVIALCLFFWWQVMKIKKEQYILYTIGKIVDSCVLETTQLIPGKVTNKYASICEFFDRNNKKYRIRVENPSSSDPQESRPPIGTKIKIVYLESNPKIATRYIENHMQKFNLGLRKN